MLFTAVAVDTTGYEPGREAPAFGPGAAGGGRGTAAVPPAGLLPVSLELVG